MEAQAEIQKTPEKGRTYERNHGIDDYRRYDTRARWLYDS
jgi:hypothetical protein